jgi:hypothetical protein
MANNGRKFLCASFAVALLSASAVAPARADLPVFGDNGPLIEAFYNAWPNDTNAQFGLTTNPNPYTIGDQVNSQFDCGTSGYAEFELFVIDSPVQFSRRSGKGCRFKNDKPRTVGGGLRVDIDSDHITVKSIRHDRRTIRREVAWEWTMTSPSGIGFVNSSAVTYPGGIQSVEGVLTFTDRYHKQKRSRRIWQSSFDDWFNICLNGKRTIRASGGRLYCQIYGHSAYWDREVEVEYSDNAYCYFRADHPDGWCSDQY